MIINTNISALSSAKHLQKSQANLDKSLARLSSGSKITDASDDAGGSAVSMKIDAQVKRFNAVKANVGNAISFTQAQDGYLRDIGSALNRMGELALLALDPTKTDVDRTFYNSEYGRLAETVIDSASKGWNGIKLFSPNPLVITSDAEGATFNIAGIDLTDIMVDIGGNIGSLSPAGIALGNIKDAIAIIASNRATVGANQARLYSVSEQISVTSENLVATSSRIQDVDVADEAAEFAKFNILMQSGTSMLAQANQLPRSALSLLQ
jgi:flagellin